MGIEIPTVEPVYTPSACCNSPIYGYGFETEDPDICTGDYCEEHGYILTPIACGFACGGGWTGVCKYYAEAMWVPNWCSCTAWVYLDDCEEI